MSLETEPDRRVPHVGRIADFVSLFQSFHHDRNRISPVSPRY